MTWVLIQTLLLAGCVTHIKLLIWPSSSKKWATKMLWGCKSHIIQCSAYGSYSVNICLSFFCWFYSPYFCNSMYVTHCPFFFIFPIGKKIGGKFNANYWDLSNSRSYYSLHFLSSLLIFYVFKFSYKAMLFLQK